jgi:hypothetical protein
MVFLMLYIKKMGILLIELQRILPDLLPWNHLKSSQIKMLIKRKYFFDMVFFH